MAPKTRSHYTTGLLIAMVAYLALVPAIVSGAGAPRVEEHGGRISITAEEATLASIAEQLSKKMGITIYLDRSEETRKVSVDVRNSSFEKSIRALVHPLNYAVVTDRNGVVTELRIFRNTSPKEGAYRVFAAPRATESKVASVEPSSTSTPAPSGSPQTPVVSASSARSGAQPSKPAEALAGPSGLVTGERAFQYSVWMNQRMKEAEQIQQSMRVRADQVEAHERQMAAVTAMTQVSANAQQGNTSPAPGLQGAMAAQQSQTQTQSFMQSNTQQRGFNNYMYYQQRAMRDNYSFYNMRRGQ